MTTGPSLPGRCGAQGLERHCDPVVADVQVATRPYQGVDHATLRKIKYKTVNFARLLPILASHVAPNQVFRRCQLHPSPPVSYDCRTCVLRRHWQPDWTAREAIPADARAEQVPCIGTVSHRQRGVHVVLGEDRVDTQQSSSTEAAGQLRLFKHFNERSSCSPTKSRTCSAAR